MTVKYTEGKRLAKTEADLQWAKGELKMREIEWAEAELERDDAELKMRDIESDRLAILRWVETELERAIATLKMREIEYAWDSAYDEDRERGCNT